MGKLDTGKLSKSARVFPRILSQQEIEQNSWGRGQLHRFRLKNRCRKSTIIDPEEPSLSAFAALEIESTTLSVQNLHEHGDLYSRYLRARRDIFIVQKRWNLPEIDGMEFDQYDTPFARWIALERGSMVIAGARISPTTGMCGSNSYMLRDAQLGLIAGLPTDILFRTAPVRPSIWEATRLFITDFTGSDERLEVQRCLMQEMAAAAQNVGATHLIGIVPAIFPRWLKRIGMTAKAVGPVRTIDGERVQAALMNVTDQLR